MKRSIPLTAVLCAVLLLPAARGRAQDLYVGSNAANVTRNFTSGLYIYNNAYVGYETNATNNLLNVSGAGTVLNNPNSASVCIIGWAGSGNSMVISNGGKVDFGEGRVGDQATASNNRVLVAGTNSLWIARLGTNYAGFGGDLFVGHRGSSNSLIISNGGTVADTFGYIGYFNSSNNSGLVTGAGSLWTNSGGLSVGYQGSGNSLVISNRGTVANREVTIGFEVGSSNNTVLVTGSNSLLTNSSWLVAGWHGSGNSLTISNGARAIVTDVYVANASGGSNTILVTGTGSLLNANGVTGDFWIGRSGFGNNSLVISDGGTVSDKSASIGYASSASNNSVLVTGTNSLWTNSGELSVGYRGSNNTLTVANGGTVAATNIVLGSQAGSSGTLNIGRLGTNDTAGTINAATIAFGTGTGTINFNQSDSTIVSAAISGNGTLNQLGAGTTTLSGANTYSGTTTISAGTMLFQSANALYGGSNALWTAANIVVSSNATAAFGVGGASGFTTSNVTTLLGNLTTVNSNGLQAGSSIGFDTTGGNFTLTNKIANSTGTGGGSLGLTKLGLGTMTLSASNTYTGGTTISAGTLELNSAGSVAGNITNNATLSINRTNSLTLTNVVSGTGALSKSGAGTAILTGANTYSGNTTISAGTLQINAGGVVSNSATTLVGSGGAGTLNISGGTFSNLSVSIGHSGGTGILNLNSGSLSAQNLAVSGNSAAAGTLNLNGGTMAVAGSFYVASGGTINVNTGGVLRGGDGGHLWVDITNSLVNFNGGTGSAGLNLFVGNGGTVDLKGQSLGTNNWGNLIASAPGGVLRNSGSNASTIATANTIWLWQGGQKLIIDASGGDILINSWITSSQMTNTGIIKTGSNALVLTYSGNDYNGGTLLQQGSLRLDHANAAGSGAITQSNAASTLQINATGTVSNAMSLYNIATLQTVTLSGSKTLNGSTYNIAAGTTTTESGVLSGAGGLTKSGTGTMTLSASNSYSGDTTISSGVLALTNGFSIADTAAVTNSGATLRVDSGETIGSLRGSGSTVLNGMAVTLTIAETNSHAYAGVISGAGGFAKTGGGTTTLAGSNTYSGDTTVGGGRLAVTGSISGSNAVYVGNEASGNSLIISNGGRVANGQGSIGYTVSSSNNSALVTGANSVWTNSGYFYVGAYGSSNSLVVSNGGTVAALISQIGTFGSSLNNSVLVTGTNSLLNNALYLFVGGSGNSGNSMVISNGGLVTVGIHSYIGGDVPADNNSVLVTGSASRWSNAFSLFVGNAGVSNSLTVANGGNASAGSGLTIAASNGSVATLNIGRFGTNDTAGTITAPTIAFGAGAGAINFNQSDATTITAAISGDGAVKQLGAGTTTLSASNTYTGDTTISAGTLRFSTANGAGGSRILQTTMASLVEFLGSGRMTNQMTVFQYSFANSFETAGQVTLADAASSIAVASGATLTGSGSFVGSGGLIKKGAGTLSLTAGNSFSGPLSVQAGTLALAASGSSAAGSVTSLGVTNGATLLVSQSHQVNNSASVTLSGGTITRGSGVSEVFGNLNLTQASFLDFGSGTAGNLTFGTYTPSSLLTINNFDFGSTLVFRSDLRTSITNSSLFSFTNGGIGSSSWDEGTSTFTITAIPEPSTYVAAIGLLAMMLWPLRRRWRAKVS